MRAFIKNPPRQQNVHSTCGCGLYIRSYEEDMDTST